MAIPDGMPRYPGDVLSLLAATEFFGGLAPDQLAHLVRVLEWETLPGGATLVRQGEMGDCLYILAHGRLVVMIHHPSGTEMPVGEVARGELVGEMAVLTDAPR